MNLKGIVGTCAALALASSVIACGERDATETTTVSGEPALTTDRMAEATAGETAIRVADLAEDPLQYQGRRVTVEADVEEVLGPLAFVLDEDAPFEGGIDNDVLVLSPRASQLSDIDDQWLNNKVRVTGTVGTMSTVEIEREIGWDLDPTLEAELEGTQAVLIAHSIERLQN